MIGGGLIGLAVALLVLVNGRVAGISGIVVQAIERDFGQGYWRLAFLLGLLLPAVLLMMGDNTYVAGPPRFMVPAGLLVGSGSYVAGGCTSGHGICGVANISGRSVGATLTFMFTAMAVVFLTRHLF